ncbi:hypothetical protein JW906_03170 [bacterium]|nr:hypothetical protein [bacterium]
MERQREYANELYNRELFQQALSEYQRLLDLYPLDDNQQANIHFIMGNIHFDRLRDYENALAHYLKIRHVFPESGLQDQTGKQIVACLERLDRSADAKQALDEAASLDPAQVHQPRPGTVIARIGDREITSGDLKFLIGRLPESLQEQAGKREAKIEFLKQYLSAELFYDAARRKGLDNDKEVIEGAFEAKKSLMVQKYLQEEITSQVQIRPEDVELYFKANKDRYAEKDEKGHIKREKTFQEAGQQAAQDLLRERQQKAYEDIMRRMMLAEKVEIYDDRIE